MSTIDYKSKRTDTNKARKLVREIVTKRSGNIVFTKHSLDELKNDNLTTVDAWNVLKSTDAKIVKEGELVNGSYRYHLETNFILLVVAFWPNGDGCNIVTAWDKRKRGRQ